MAQFEHLKFSEDGKTIIRCDKDYAGILVIPLGVTKIASKAFDGCANIKHILITRTVSKIESKALTNCPNLQEIYVFDDNPYFCSSGGILYSKDMETLIAIPAGMKSLVIPESVNKFEIEAFRNSVNTLKVIRLKNPTPINLSSPFPLFCGSDGKKTMYESFVALPKNLEKIYVPKGSAKAYQESESTKRFKDIIEE